MKIDINSIPLAIYVHIPWCIEKCPYCDFNSHKLREDSLPEEEYIARVAENLSEYAPLVKGRKVSSIFFGGGTPSIMSPDGIDKILNTINKHYKLEQDTEITCEANPGTFDQKKFEGFFKIGINRLSVGVQSFNDDMLQKLGRIHDSQTAKKAIKLAQDVGFTNINLDLMYGLPGQTAIESSQDLLQALEFNTKHLSWYQLTLEPNTLFYKKPPKLPESEIIHDIENAGHKLLRANGMQQYEISAWAKSYQDKCKHNYNIWQFGDYIGVGAGAAGKITLANNIIRTMQTKHPKQFINGQMKINDKIVAQQDIAFEFMLNHLRLKEPLYFALMENRTGITLADIAPVLDNLPPHSVIYDNNKLELTAFGFNFYNDIVAAFMLDQ